MQQKAYEHNESDDPSPWLMRAASHLCVCVCMMAEGGESLELFPPAKKTKSAVWEFFGYRKHSDGHGLEEEGRPTCKTCLKRVSARGGNTSNMIAHLREHHPSRFAKFKGSSISSSKGSSTSKASTDQPTIQQTFEKQIAYAPKSKHATSKDFS
nr:E3 SUMO-protein ligase ZBED1-like [Misgurnus anguillicaudatus]